MSDTHDYSGMWHVTYWYPSNQRPGEEESTGYYCQAEQRGSKIVFESVADRPDHMNVNVTVDHSIVTGNWSESTNPEGEFEGMEYSGAIQLLVKDGGARLTGKWVGVGREKLDDGSYEPQVYTGRWEMTRAGS
jgi:hypothetical protein